MQKLPLPEAIANAPSLMVGLEFFYSAFLDLNTTRSDNYGGEGPISWLAVTAWANEYGVFGEQREDLHFFIGELDKAYLDYKVSKIKKANEATIEKTGKVGGRLGSGFP